MTPHEVRARCAELGTPVVQSTLANYKSAGLIYPPVVQSMGRNVGKISTYRDEVPYEIYTAQRLSGRDFGFSLESVALFRAQWLAGAGQDWKQVLALEAQAIADEDLAANRHMGALGAGLIAPGSGVLTHCNTGSLATAGFGTALGVIRAGVAAQRIARVFAGETRPWNQGARLTVWELQQDGIDATLIADAAASHLMKTGQVQWVVVGADRICANGDTANKIGTYQLAIAAKHHGLKFMVVAPSSTVDMDTASGDLIEIEERDPAELLAFRGERTVAEGVHAWNPVFDVTPHELIDAIVTEKGVVERPDTARMRAAFPA